MRHHHAQLSANRALVELCQLRELREALPDSLAVLALGTEDTPTTVHTLECYAALRGIELSESSGSSGSPSKSMTLASRFEGDYHRPRIQALLQRYKRSGEHDDLTLVDATYNVGLDSLVSLSLVHLD
ncbi:hypothetical protein NMY22_g14365 [Coprinellus aureogranulatus]|nr:hypothetical protein NMY22_g14365 [Coprinellus aureogranulatus]